MNEQMQATRWLLNQPMGAHIMATMFMGQTADHLRSTHPTEPTDETKVGNLRAHIRAHRVAEDTP